MVRVRLKYKRKTYVEEEGGVTVEVKDPEDTVEIERRFRAQMFEEFLTTKRTYDPDYDQWSYEILNETTDDEVA